MLSALATLMLLSLQTSAKITTPSTRLDAAASYAAEPYVLEHFDKRYRMRTDGTGEFTQHVVYRVQSEGAAKSLSVLAVFFNAENSVGAIENVRVHKSDGTVVTTPSSDSIELAAPVTREAPLYSDMKERQLPVRSLSAGDTLECDMRITYTKPKLPTTSGAAIIS